MIKFIVNLHQVTIRQQKLQWELFPIKKKCNREKCQTRFLKKRDILETIMLAENKSWNEEIRVAATEW